MSLLRATLLAHGTVPSERIQNLARLIQTGGATTSVCVCVGGALLLLCGAVQTKLTGELASAATTRPQSPALTHLTP